MMFAQAGQASGLLCVMGVALLIGTLIGAIIVPGSVLAVQQVCGGH